MLARRVTFLERKLAPFSSDDGPYPCRCQHPSLGAILWPGDTLKDTDDIPCGVCGGALPVIAVRYDDEPIHEEE
jgi:hypothetical protein